MASIRTSTRGRAYKSRGTGVVVQGLDAVVTEITRKAATIQGEVDEIVVEYAGKAADEMRETVPQDEGDVYDSITADTSAKHATWGSWAEAGPDADANDQAFVARFLVYGTVKMSPRWDFDGTIRPVASDFDRAINKIGGL